MSTTLKFCVQGQRITRADSIVVVADSLNYIYAEFSFCSDWNGLTKTAVFTRGEDSYEMLLDENDRCLVPHEVMETGQAVFKVSVFAGNLITTAPVKVRVDASGWSFALESSDPTPGIYQQVIARLDAVEAAVDGAIEAVAETVGPYVEQASGFADDAAASASAAEQSAEAAASYKPQLVNNMIVF